MVSIAESPSDSYVTCLHLSEGAKISKPSTTHDCALLVVYGTITITLEDVGSPSNVSAGVGAIVEAGERYRLESKQGAIVVAIEIPGLRVTAASISTPMRIMGQRWPGEA